MADRRQVMLNMKEARGSESALKRQVEPTFALNKVVASIVADGRRAEMEGRTARRQYWRSRAGNSKTAGNTKRTSTTREKVTPSRLLGQPRSSATMPPRRLAVTTKPAGVSPGPNFSCKFEETHVMRFRDLGKRAFKCPLCPKLISFSHPKHDAFRCHVSSCCERARSRGLLGCPACAENAPSAIATGSAS